MKSLLPDLVRYGGSDLLPMHMPGHKRKSGFLGGLGKLDITEVEGFDDLHHPEGVLKQTQEEAAALYGSDASFFLVNGSTCGLLTAISAVTNPGDKLLLARNCHKAVLNAVCLRELDPLYVYPEKESPLQLDGSIDPALIDAMLTREEDIRAVVVTSPTYEGVVSDIAGIAQIVHRHDLPLIVDAAHGAHFRFSPDFPAAALDCGADLVVESLHKTLPSLTQTALLHVKSTRVDLEAVRFYLQVFQSSSPSYLLIASITECLRIMTGEGAALMASYTANLASLRQSLTGLAPLTLVGREGPWFDYDPGKLVFGVKGYGGGEIAALLRRDFHIETEMAAPAYTVAMTSLYDDAGDLFRFGAALARLCRELPLSQGTPPLLPRLIGEKVLTPAAARRATRCSLPLARSIGGLAAETLYLYPPGTPLLVAGERISEKTVAALKLCEKTGFSVHGVANDCISVI